METLFLSPCHFLCPLSDHHLIVEVVTKDFQRSIKCHINYISCPPNDLNLQLDRLYPALFETLAEFGEKFDFKTLPELLRDYHAQLDRTQPQDVNSKN